MNFLQICQSARQECGVQGEGPAAVTGQVGVLKRVVEWCRDADLFVQRLHPDWSFLWTEFTEDTTLGSETVTVPSDIATWDTESFAIERGTTDGTSLELIDFRTWRSNHYLKENEEPTQICILPNKQLRLQAPADAVYEIYGNYWKQPVTMTANTDEPLYDDEFHRIVVAKAKMWFFEDSEMTNLYQIAEKEFLEILVGMRGRYLPDHTQLTLNSPEQIVVRAL